MSSAICNTTISILVIYLMLGITFVQFNHVYARPTPGFYALTPTTNFLSDTKLVSFEKEMYEVAEVMSPTSIPAALIEWDQHYVSVPTSSKAENRMNNDSDTTTNFEWKTNTPWLCIVIMIVLSGGGLSVHIYCHSRQPPSAASLLQAHAPACEIELTIACPPAQLQTNI